MPDSDEPLDPTTIRCGVCGHKLPTNPNQPSHPPHDYYDLEPIQMELDRLAFPLVLRIMGHLVAEAFVS